MRVTLVAINATYMHTNLAVRCLHAAVSRALPHIPHTVLELHGNQPFATHLRAIWATEPDVVCFSTYIWNRERVFSLARTLKRAMPGIRIALGGPEVSFDLEQTLARHLYIDAIVPGEGEESYPALLAAFAQGSAAPPLTPIIAPERWPDPYADAQKLDPGRIWYAETSRGCPFQCRFCLSAAEAVRALPAGEAVEKLRALAGKGAALVKLVDRTFNYDAARARDIWRGLLALDAGCAFHFEIDACLLTDECLDLLKTVPQGRFQFEIGVQSASPEVLRAVRRVGPFEGVARAVGALREAGNIPLHLDLIAGLPEESWASFAHGFDLVHALRPHRLQLGFLKLLPGSGLHRDAEKLGIAYAPDPPYEVLATPALSFAELQMLHDVERALDWYGNSGRHPALMRLVIGEGSPFAAYHALACRLRGDGLFDADRSAAQRAGALERYAAALPGVGADAARAALQEDQTRQLGYKRYRGK